MRKIVAAVLSAFAVFIVLFGAGMTSWAIVVLGLALLTLAIALVVVGAVRGGTRSWVDGSGHVLSASEPPPNSTYGRCELQIVVEAPGVPAAAVKIRDPRVPVAKWPDVGSELPIKVAMEDPRRVRILWDDVLTHSEAAAAGLTSRYDDRYDDRYTERGPMPGGTPPRVPTEPPVREEDRISGTDDVDPGDGSSLAGDTPTDGRSTGRDEVVVTQTPTGPVVEGRLVNRPGSPAPGPFGSSGPAGSSGGGSSGGGGSSAAADGSAPRRPRPYPPKQRRASDPSASADVGGAGVATAVVTEPGDADRPESPATPQEAPSRPEAVRPEDAGGGRPIDADLTDDAVLAQLITAYPSARPGPTGSIHGVGITMLVTDLERSVAFYRDMLGFYEIDGGEGNAVLASGDTRLVLRTVRDVAPVVRRVVHINLEVGDVEAVYEELKAKGVRFTYGPRSVNRGARLELWAAAFRDPDGHGIALTQWRGRPAG